LVELCWSYISDDQIPLIPFYAKILISKINVLS